MATQIGIRQTIQRFMLGLIAALTWVASTFGADPGQVRLVTDASSYYGLAGNAPSDEPRITANGRYVAFASAAANLTPDDRNGSWDVFIVDRSESTIDRLQLDFPGAQSHWGSITDVAISDDGSLVAFARHVSAVSRVIIHNRATNETVVLSGEDAMHSFSKVSAVRVSGNGRIVGFHADEKIVFYDTLTKLVTTHFAHGTSGHSVSEMDPVMSGDGSMVAFSSDSSTLVESDNNGRVDVFLYDRIADTVELVSVNVDGTQSDGHSGKPSISRDGRLVVFSSQADLLDPQAGTVDSAVFLLDRSTGVIDRLSPGDDNCDRPALSGDGNYLAMWCASQDGFKLLDLQTGAGADIFPMLDLGKVSEFSIADGGALVFATSRALDATDVNGEDDVYIYELAQEFPVRLSVASGVLQSGANGAYSGLAMTDTGAVAYQSWDPLLVGPGRADQIVVWDPAIGNSVLSLDLDGAPGQGASVLPSISRSGHWAAFWTFAPNMIPGVDRSVPLVALDRRTNRRHLVSEYQSGRMLPAIFSATETAILFSSSQDDLLFWDANNVADVFFMDLESGVVELISRRRGLQGNSPSYAAGISGDNRYVLFSSASRTLMDVDSGNHLQPLLKDRTTGDIKLLPFSEPGFALDGDVDRLSMSDSARWVAMTTTASNVAVPRVAGLAGSTAVYLLDRLSGEVILVSDFHERHSCSSAVVEPEGRAVYMTCATGVLSTTTRHSVYQYEIATGTLRELFGGSEFVIRAEEVGISGNGSVIAARLFAPAITAGVASTWSHSQIYQAEISMMPAPVSTPEVIFNDDFE